MHVPTHAWNVDNAEGKANSYSSHLCVLGRDGDIYLTLISKITGASRSKATVSEELHHALGLTSHPELSQT